MPLDVDDDAEVTTADESALSNFLDANDGGPVSVPNDPPPEPGESPYYDVDDNWVVNQADLDAVSDALAGGGGGGESNSPPVAHDSAEAVGHSDTLDTNLNAQDDDGDDLTYSLLTGPQHGTVNLSAIGDYLYDPENSYIGTDVFTYTVSDGQASDTATVTIQVTNDRPEALDQSWWMGFVSVVWHAQVYGRDYDNDPLTFSLHSNPAHGTITMQPSGHFTYTPEVNYAGNDSFQFIATDSFGAVSDPAIVGFTVALPSDRMNVMRIRDAIEGIQTGQFKFTRPASASPETIYFRFAPTSSATLDDPATPPGDGDFTSSHSPFAVTFAANQTEIVATITAYDDDVPESESVIVQILDYPAPGQGAVPYTIGYNNAEVFIKDPPIVSAVGTSVAEGDTSTTTATVTISLSYAIPVATTVNFLTNDGSATTADNDYAAVGSGSVVIPAGQTTASSPATVSINGDRQHEPDESFQLQITSTSVAAVNVNPTAATIGITNDDYVPVISALSSVTYAEGADVSIVVSVTDQDTPSSGITITASGSPAGIQLTGSTIAGRLDFLAAGTHSITVTATDSDGHVGTSTFTLTVTEVTFASLTGQERQSNLGTSNALTVTGPSSSVLYALAGNRVRLTTTKSPAGANTITIGDWQVQLKDANGTPMPGGVYSPNPNEYLTVDVPASGDMVVELYLDANLDQAVTASELTQSFIVRSISFAGTTIKDRRTGGGPVESTDYDVVAGEHFEVGGIFAFELDGMFPAGSAGSPLLKHALIGDGVLVDSTLDSGQGTRLSHEFLATEVTGFGGYTGVHVECFYDANENDAWDSGETGTYSPYIDVKSLRVIDVNVTSSTTVGQVTASQIQAILDGEAALALQRDSADDWRARVRFNVTSVGTAFTPTASQRDPVTSQADFDQLGTLGFRLVFVDGLYQTYQPNPNSAGLTVVGQPYSLVDWNDRTSNTIIHEFGHQFGLEHAGHSSQHIMSGTVPDGRELLREDAEAYEEN